MKNMEKKKKKKAKQTQKLTAKQRYYRMVFDDLMYIAIKHPRPPKKLLEAWDAVADFIGDVAMGRRK